jgi:hypothetical protein
MSYYILPKNINVVNVNPRASYDVCNPHVSHSLFKHYYLVKQQIIDMFDLDYNLSNESFDNAIKLINPYEFIFSKVPGSKFSVSKLKPSTNVFYDLFEISNNLNLFDSLKIIQPIYCLHLSPNYSDSIECFEMFRDNYPDNHVYIDNVNSYDNQFNDAKFDFLFCETNSANYFISLIKTIIVILKNQKTNGTTIIKISDIFHKPTIDVLYLLSSLYDKIYICKPNTNNVASFDRYVVCKNFLHDERSSTYLKHNYLTLIIFLKKLENRHVNSIIDIDVPYYFKNKIDELNIIIGQQQLESLDQIIAIYKNKNKYDRIESIKKNNIQKSVSWCEKYKIPCNKFAEKTNIFLPIINEIT